MAQNSKTTTLKAPISSTYLYTLESYFNETSTSISENYSTIYCKATLSAQNVSFESTNGGTLSIYWHDNRDNTDILVASKVINSCGMTYGSRTVDGYINAIHNNDGTLSGYSYAYFTKNKNSSYIPASGGVATDWTTLTTIARASSVSGGSGNIGESTTINISRASNSFTHTLRYAFGNLSGTIANNVQTSYSWTIPTSFYNQIPSSNNGIGTIYCDTYNNGTLIGTKSISFTAYVTNSNPIFDVSNISYQDTNSSIVAITENNQKIVRNQSNLSVAFTNAVAQNGASISNYVITFNGNSQTKTTSSTINYGTVNISQNTSVTIKVTDSRGNTTSASKPITILDWVNPSAIVSLKRINNYEDDTKLKVQVTISSVDSKNSIQSIKYRYKKTSDSSYSEYTNINNNTEYTINLNKNFAWDTQIQIQDKFGTTTYNLILQKGMPILFIDVEKQAVGVETFPTEEGSINIAKSIFINNKKLIYEDDGLKATSFFCDLIYPVGSIYMSVNNTSPQVLFGGVWQQLQDRFLVGAGNNYAVNSTGGANSVTLTANQSGLREHNHSASGSYSGANFYIRHGLNPDTDTVAPGTNTTVEEGVGVKWSNGFQVIGHEHNIDRVNIGGTVGVSVNNAGPSNATESHENRPPYLAVYMWKRTA